MIKKNTYLEIGIDHLVIYAVNKIVDSGEECDFERIVFECYTLFPAAFSLRRYPQWPDSARINKAWLRCRTDEGWLTGSVKEGFRLTPMGAVIAKKVARKLGYNETKKRPNMKRARDRYDSVVNYILRTDQYRNYANHSSAELSNSELISFLGGTLETPNRILRQNLNLYLNAALTNDNKEIIEFLILCKNRLSAMRG